MALLLSPYIIFVPFISLIKYIPSMIWSDQNDLIWSDISIILSKILSTLFDLILFLQYNMFALINPLRYAHSDLIWFNPIQSNLTCSLNFDPLTPICSNTIYYYHSNPIQYDRSLFPALISPLRSLGTIIFLRNNL